MEFFTFNSYVYYLTRGFNASTRAFNFPTCAFNLGTRTSSFLTRASELITRKLKLVSREFELVTSRFEFVIRKSELVTRISELVTRDLLFHLCFLFPHPSAIAVQLIVQINSASKINIKVLRFRIFYFTRFAQAH